jgi:hypothetical protein
MSVDELQEKINQLKRIKGLIKNAKWGDGDCRKDKSPFETVE